MNPPVVCVLGMHRSGTSCLVGSLQRAGLYLGRHHTWNKHNRRGNRENQDIVELNDSVLRHSGGSWKEPPGRVRHEPAHLDRARAIIEEFNGAGRWGFKDPRALLTFDLWREALGDRCRRVGIFRHPVAAARSLRCREGEAAMPEKQALGLWAHYNRRLLAEYRREPFPLLCFDWDEEVFHHKLEQAHRYLELPPPDPADRFYSAALKTHEAGGINTVPWRYRRLYRKLLSMTV